MDANPLNGLFLDKPIHTSINQHFQYFPLDQDLFHNNAYKVYHLHFVLGLLASISTPKRGGIFVRHMENNLRIFTVEAERVRLHNVFYENIIDEKTSRPMITPNEFYSIKKIAKNLNLGMSDWLTVENYVYGLKKLQEKDDLAVAILKLLDLNDFKTFQILRMPPEEGLGNNFPELNSPHGPLVELHPITGQHNGLASLISRKHKKFSMTHLKEIAKYMYSTKPLEHIAQSGPLGRAAYMQGTFFKSINEYYNTLRKSPIPVISYNDGSFSMCLPSIVEPDHYTMLNFGPRNQAAHRLLFGLKNEDLLIHEVNINVETTNEFKETDVRKVKFSLENILNFMEHDFFVAKDLSQMQDYQNTIRGFLNSLGVSHVGQKSLKAFLFGLLASAAHSDVHVAYKPNNDGFSIEALLLMDGVSKCLLTFDATGENYPNVGSLDTFSNEDNNILHLNLAAASSEQHLQISTSATSLEEAAKVYDFEQYSSYNLKSVLQIALDLENIEQPGQLKKNLEEVFHDLFGQSMHISEIKTDFGFYMSGLFAHFKHAELLKTMPSMQSQGMGMLIPVQVRAQEHVLLIYISLKNFAGNVAQLILPFGKVRETHSLSVAYNTETKEIALLGLNSKTVKFNTENMESACSSHSRRKRGSSSACSFFYNEEENRIKIDEKEIKETIEGKNPLLKEHLSRIYELTGKIQMGFLARDFVGDLVQHDTKALVRDGFFFGGNLLAQKVGSIAAQYGEKVASKALSRSIMSFGLCLPKLAFDGYIAYQMVQQIKNNDTVGAVTTGAFLAIDMAECALQALVTFGLITLNPLVLPVMAIASTLLLIGMNFYDAMKKVKEIDHVVHLSSEEYTYEFIREFFHAGTDAYIQHLMDEKQANEYIVSKLSRNYPNIKRFLVSAAIMKEDKSISFIDDNKIDLSEMKIFEQRSRAMPEVSDPQSLFCTMSEEPHEKPLFQKVVDYALYLNFWQLLALLVNTPIAQKFRDFYCHNAFGVSMLNASHSEKTMFLLFDGNDNVTGFQYASNIFQIGNGSKLILGGDHDDYFKLTSGAMTGSLNGANGYDTVDFSEYGHNKLVSIRGNVVKLFQGGETFSLKNIESIVGRRNTSDIIYICNENRIDLGGSLNNFDLIFITENEDEKCLPPTNLTIYLRKDTYVTCTSEEAKVTYLVDEDSRGTVETESGSHHFYFQGLKLTDIGRVEFNGTSFSLEFGSNGGQLTINDASNVSMEFEDHIRMKLLNGTFMAYMDAQESVFHIIEKYSQYIEKNPFMTLVANTSEGMIVLNHNHHSIQVNNITKQINIIVDNDNTNAHLVGHENAENYFLLFSNLSMIGLQTIDLKIHTCGGFCHIDLNDFARFIQSSTNGDFGLQVLAEKSGQNVKLELQKVPNKLSRRGNSLGKITIINGMNFTSLINIHTYGTNVLKLINQKIIVQSLPIETNQSVIVILPGQLDFYANPFIDRVSENMEPYFLNGTLMLTNALSLESSDLNYTTILLSDFLIYKNKYQTIQLEFVDRKMQLKHFYALSTMDGMNIDMFWKKLLLSNLKKE